MQRAIIRNTDSPGLGVTMPLVSLIASASVVLVSTVQFFLGAVWTLGPTGTESSVRLSLCLLGGLTLACVPWIFAVVRGWVPATTGAGLVLASCGLATHAVAEFGRWLVLTLPRVPVESREALEPLETGAALGLVAYVAGLAFLASACLAARRFVRGRSGA